MNLFLILAVVVVVVQAESLHDEVKDEWSLFKKQFNKKYDSQIEERFRMKIFMENKRKISKHNLEFEQGRVTFSMGLNHLSDMLPHEVSRFNGYKRSNRTMRSSYIEPAHVTLATEVDWRIKGAVTPVKNQGNCLSDWAFSATGSLEGQHFRKTGKLVSLSEQNLIDCSRDYDNKGCHGGFTHLAFEYMLDNKGIDTERSYPYEGMDNKCHFQQQNVGASISGFVDILSENEDFLKSAVATIGPISVAIDASHDSFLHYEGGIYYEPNCSPRLERLVHAVLVVGYGTSANGEDYWIVKNSWGPQWGDNGYIKMARNKDNNCGIATYASFPLV